MRIALGFALLLAACGGKSSSPDTTPTPTTAPVAVAPPAPATPDCATAVGTAMDQMVAASKTELDSMAPDQRKQAEDMLASMLPKMKQVTTDACVNDKWSPAAVTCVGATKSEADFSKCSDLLTPAQKQNAQTAMQAAMGAPPPPAAPPAK